MLKNINSIRFLSSLFAGMLLSLTSYAAAGGLQVTDLKCEYAVHPLGIDNKNPQLSWRITADTRGVSQQSRQILVATSLEFLSEDNADMWNGGWIASAQSAGVEYGGKELQSHCRYYWKVRIRTDENTVSDWSEPAWFEMGLLNPSDWLSGWIAYVPGMPGRVLYFKTTYHVEKTVKQARAYVSGLGFYEMYINNRKVGDRVLEPAQSTYPKRIYYSTYDVSDYLSEKDNVIYVAVAPGWYGTPSLRFQMEIENTDGSRDYITSDWLRHVTTGPVVYSTLFDGELYDARLATGGLYKPYDPPGLMNRDWAWAHNTDDTGENMKASAVEPIQIVDTIVPEMIAEPKPGIYVVDAGRNLAGWAELKVTGREGDKITLRFAETLYDNGLVNQENLRNAKAEDTYILDGKGTETWHPAFTYHGFRYIQVEGFPYKPKTGDITVHVVRSAVAVTGKFNCSNQLLNDIHRMVVNTEASNLHSVPTDCPQRDERMGWLNDLTVRIEQAIYNFDMSRFYPKFITDISDTQDEKGTITCVAPFRFGMRPADPVSASYLLLAYKCYEFYGNRQVIAEHFDGMKAWTDYLYSRTDNGIVDYSYYGDWCPPRDFLQDPNGSGVSRDTPGKMISTGYLYYCAKILSEMAKVIGKNTDATYYQALASEIRTAFNREYWNEKDGGYASNNQASNAFALYMGLVDEKKTPLVVANLAKDVEKHDFHLTTGNLCTKYLLEMLTEHGHAEAAYRIAAQTTYPGWGFMLSKGATTLWERWEYATGDAMNSHNHPMMGSVGSWFYKYVLGIRSDFERPGFEQFIIKPVIFNDLTFAEGELNTVKGIIGSAWKKNGKDLSLRITVPGNAKAIVYFPTQSEKNISENGKNISKIKEIRFLRKENRHVVFEIGSGNYLFTVKNFIN
ncbi:MAG: glycoside hydrolase family 78 protein [Bacteroidales bacterium]|jgi:alpha-L-rhamnosidase|nr:glycoside hydrolase family 78 protein [Bacteroidales bacterium]